MRLLITTDVLGGVWTYTAELVDALVRRGHDVAVVSFGGEAGARHRNWLAERPTLEFTALPHPLEWMPEPEPELSRSVDALRAEVARFGPDIVHLNQFFYGAFDLGAPKLVVGHSDVVSWWSVVKGEAPPADAWFRRYRRWVGRGLAGADARAAPSEWLAARLTDVYAPGPIHAIHNARSPALFRPAPAPDRRGRLVVAAGRLWDEGKGMRDLIPAAARLDGRAEIVLAGAVEHPAGGDDFPVDAPGITWAGELAPPELRGLLSRATVYAATSHYEPFGLAPLEAVLSGCALVTADIPTFRELWDGCARFYPPGDGDALSEAIRELLEDDALRASLASRAQRRARERFTPARMARDYEEIYEHAMEAAPKQPR